MKAGLFLRLPRSSLRPPDHSADIPIGVNRCDREVRMRSGEDAKDLIGKRLTN